MNERTDGRTTRAHPIRGVLRERGQSQNWLARRVGMAESYVRAMVAGAEPASPRFRAGASALLGLPESVLFHLSDSSSAGAPGDTDGTGYGAGVAVDASVPAAAGGCL